MEDEGAVLLALLERVKLHFLPDEAEYIPSDEFLLEAIRIVYDRLAIQIDSDTIPKRGESIVVDAAIKLARLRGYEGSHSESAADGGSFSVSFVDDVLSSYAKDIAMLKEMAHRSGVQFL